ncbi:MAG: flagellar basal body L-ring protein FlgH [Hyphomicrobiales bacterium]
MIRAGFHKFALAITAAALLAGCGTVDKLKDVGRGPQLSAIDNPATQPGYKPVQMPMPAPEMATYNPNSLWRTGSRAFFKDQRAHQVGDILTIHVSIADQAKIDNATNRKRSASEDWGVAGALDTPMVERWFMPDGTSAKTVLDSSSGASSTGSGSVKRSEQVDTNIAAVVMQVLPNGNLVIEGKQEVRVNFEIREMIVAGIVRPEDIAADNTVESSKIAQARISYGGRGQITDVQQPRYGQQVLDIILPF